MAAAELVGVRPDMFCCTTGTTGVSKLIPMHGPRIAAAHKVSGQNAGPCPTVQFNFGQRPNRTASGCRNLLQCVQSCKQHGVGA